MKKILKKDFRMRKKLLSDAKKFQTQGFYFEAAKMFLLLLYLSQLIPSSLSKDRQLGDIKRRLIMIIVNIVDTLRHQLTISDKSNIPALIFQIKDFAREPDYRKAINKRIEDGKKLQRAGLHFEAAKELLVSLYQLMGLTQSRRRDGKLKDIKTRLIAIVIHITNSMSSDLD